MNGAAYFYRYLYHTIEKNTCLSGQYMNHGVSC